MQLLERPTTPCRTEGLRGRRIPQVDALAFDLDKRAIKAVGPPLSAEPGEPCLHARSPNDARRSQWMRPCNQVGPRFSLQKVVLSDRTLNEI